MSTAKEQAEAWANDGLKLGLPLGYPEREYYRFDRNPWKPIRVITTADGETRVYLTLPWKRRIWDLTVDNIVEHYVVYMLAWHKFFHGYKARWGLVLG
jgi:hypothetical protein